MKKAALFFDVDGTLIDEQTKIVPESTLRALKQARENGHLVFINTGRTSCNILDSMKHIPVDGYVCGCGTEIIYQGNVLMHSTLTKEQCRRYIQVIQECHMEGVLEASDDLYFPQNSSRFPEIEDIRQRMGKAWGLGCKKYIEDGGFIYDKMFLLSDQTSDVVKFIEEVRDDLAVIDRRHGSYECIQKQYTKATGIEYMRKYLGYDMDQIYVFGDSSNDLAMFEYATHTVAMKEHDSVLDPYTEYVTDSVMNDGIEKAMKHYQLI